MRLAIRWAFAGLLLLLSVGCAESTDGSKTADDSASSAVAPAAVSSAAEPSATDAGLAGQWVLNIDTPMGVSHPLLTVTETAGSYSATYEGRQGLLAIDKVTSDGNRFSFPLSITVPIGTIEVNYRGVIEGDRMTGVVQNPRGEVPFSGERK